jgi:hypothetical protein
MILPPQKWSAMSCFGTGQMGVKWSSLSPITLDLVEYREEGKSPHGNIDIDERIIVKGTLKNRI